MDSVNVNPENQFLKEVGKMIVQSSCENLFMLLVADNTGLSWTQASSICAINI